jgi:hypothetical protein
LAPHLAQPYSAPPDSFSISRESVTAHIFACSPFMTYTPFLVMIPLLLIYYGTRILQK